MLYNNVTPVGVKYNDDGIVYFAMNRALPLQLNTSLYFRNTQYENRTTQYDPGLPSLPFPTLTPAMLHYLPMIFLSHFEEFPS